MSVETTQDIPQKFKITFTTIKIGGNTRNC